jgi:hypothetical protein
MQKQFYFDSRWEDGWPHPDELKRYFLALPGQEWFYTGGNDTGGLNVDGLHDTGHLEMGQGRIDARLMMWGNPKLGVLVMYRKYGGGFQETFTSKGDMSRLRELVYTLHDTPLPVGLFIPFAMAWPAVKEFIETDGVTCPTSIAWVANKDLPANTFPDPPIRRA